jgi:Cytochrome P450
MLQLLMAAQKGQLNKTDDEDVGTIGEDAADSELHKKHMSSKKGDALSNVNFVRHATINIWFFCVFSTAEMSNQDIAAQAFIFFFAGYETVATLLAFAAHELAENPDIQERLRDEIDQAINGDGLSYDSVMGLKYLEMVVSGTFLKIL